MIFAYSPLHLIFCICKLYHIPLIHIYSWVGYCLRKSLTSHMKFAPDRISVSACFVIDLTWQSRNLKSYRLLFKTTCINWVTQGDSLHNNLIWKIESCLINFSSETSLSETSKKRKECAIVQFIMKFWSIYFFPSLSEWGKGCLGSSSWLHASYHFHSIVG